MHNKTNDEIENMYFMALENSYDEIFITDKGGKSGLVDAAGGGTLFLDEIGEMPISVQVKLLRLIQEKEYIPVGGDKIKFANVRIIAATNQNLVNMIERKEFRSDLYYRLKIVEFELPPLRKRSEDIAGLSNYFIGKLNHQYNSSNYFSKECMKEMIKYKWNGNIRELKNIIEQMIIFAEGDEIRVSDLPEHVVSSIKNLDYKGGKLDCGVDYIEDEEKNYQNQNANIINQTLKQSLEELEKQIVVDSYKKFKTSTAVAKHLGISQSQAYRKIEKYLDCKD